MNTPCIGPSSSRKDSELQAIKGPQHYQRAARLQELLKTVVTPLLLLFLTSAMRGQSPGPILVETISLPTTTIYTSATNVSLPVVTSTINAADNLIGFQGDLFFDERVVTFQSPPVSNAGITSGNWNVSGSILPGEDWIRTLHISISSNDGTPLSGAGTLFNLDLTRVSSAVSASTPLAWTWAVPPHDLVFIDGNLDTHAPDHAPPGSITIAQETISISGNIFRCSPGNPGPVSDVTLNLTGNSTNSVLSGESGNYMFSPLASSGTYTVTPSKAARTPGSFGGSEGINMIDVIAVLRHVLHLGTPLSGCRLAAADVNGDNMVNTVDVMAILQFFLGETTSIANVGQYSFAPPSRTYEGLIGNQMGQNYDALVFGDIASPLGDPAPFFDPNANSLVKVIVRQPDGKILIGGYFTSLSPNGGAPVPRNCIARLNLDGTLDTAFNPNASGAVLSIVVQPDGKILIGGFFTTVGGQTRNRIARLEQDGSLDTVFNPDANGNVFSLALQTDGKILASGWFTTVGGQPHEDMARLDPTTGEADSFAPDLQGLDDRPSISSMLVQPDGKILLGGYFSSFLGESRRNIARLNLDGTPDLDFHPVLSGADHYGDVFAVTLQPDGKVLLGGAFTTVGGLVRNHIARVDATTGAPDSFDPNVPNIFDYVYSLAVQEDGMILAGGLFASDLGQESIGGQPRNYIARLDSTTGLADSFDPNANFPVVAIMVQPDGKILVGGGFTNIGGQTRNCIARLDSTTGLAGRINPGANSAYDSNAPAQVVADECMINYITAVRAGLRCDE